MSWSLSKKASQDIRFSCSPSKSIQILLTKINYPTEEYLVVFSPDPETGIDFNVKFFYRLNFFKKNTFFLDIKRPETMTVALFVKKIKKNYLVFF